MKNFVKNLILIGALVALVIYGKQYIDNTAFNIEDTVTHTLREYYTTDNTKKLVPILNLININKKDSTIINEINQVAFEEIGSWYNYLDTKYLCDLSNKMACSKLLEEINKLSAKVNQIYFQKEDDITIISENHYKELINTIEKRIGIIKQITENYNAARPRTNRETITQKCLYVHDCTDCNGSNAKFCTCIYENDKMSCPKNLVLGKIIDSR